MDSQIIVEQHVFISVQKSQNCWARLCFENWIIQLPHQDHPHRRFHPLPLPDFPEYYCWYWELWSRPNSNSNYWNKQLHGESKFIWWLLEIDMVWDYSEIFPPCQWQKINFLSCLATFCRSRGILAHIFSANLHKDEKHFEGRWPNAENHTF